MTITNLIDTTFTGKDISTTFVSVYEYTATATNKLYIQTRLANVAGGGAYVLYLALNDGDVLTDDLVAPRNTTYTAGAGALSLWFEFSSIEVQAGDVINIMAIGRPTDTSVGGSIRIFKDDVWGAITRTLTQSAASVASAIAGTDITIYKNTSVSVTLTGLTDFTGWSKVWFTAKNELTDTDASATFQLAKSSPSSTSDGLLYLNGSTATASGGSITVNSVTSITVALTAATAAILPRGALYYDVKALVGTSVNAISEGGRLTVLDTVTRSLA